MKEHFKRSVVDKVLLFALFRKLVLFVAYQTVKSDRIPLGCWRVLKFQVFQTFFAY